MAISKQKTASIICFVVTFLFLITLFSLATAGKSSRKFKQLKNFYLLKQEKQAFKVWQKAKVKGRVVVHFSAHLPIAFNNKSQTVAGISELKANNKNYLYVASQLNIVRKIIAVVPVNLWPAVQAKLNASGVYAVHNGYAEGWLDGMPITILPLKKLPLVNEPVLLNFSSDFFTSKEEPHKVVASLLQLPRVCS